MNGYVLGVDGGNTKTDYMLFTSGGSLARHIRKGTVSHENFPDGFTGAENEMRKHLDELLVGLRAEDLAGSAFGLAGLDHKWQYDKGNEMLQRLGFQRYAFANDGFLGIKAASENGHGICSINGTGTVTVGIDPSGNRLQIGGVGFAGGDEAGGSHIAEFAVRIVYDSLFRCGPETAVREPLFKFLGVSDKHEFIGKAMGTLHSSPDADRLIMDILYDCADLGDTVARGTLEYIGEQLALSAAGCSRELSFTEQIDVIFAGSVWVKPESRIMPDAFASRFNALSPQPGNFIKLTLPPAVGAVLWAMELAHGSFPEKQLREKVFAEIRK